LTKDLCQHTIGQIAMSAVDTEEAMKEITVRSNSETTRTHDLAEG
jgi:hypothetical protein